MATDDITANITCPQDSAYFACGDGSRFVGCCASDTSPCGSTGCAAGSLQPASFDAGQYDQLGDQECSDSGSRFYKCGDETPTFIGCCKSDPCGGTGCPTGSLTGAYLSGNEVLAGPFLRSNVTWMEVQKALTTSATTFMTTTSPPSTQVTSASDAEDTALSTTTFGARRMCYTAGPGPQESTKTWTSCSPHNHIGTIVGSCLGAAFLIAMAIMCFFLRRMRKKRKAASASLSKATTQERPLMAQSNVPSVQNTPQIGAVSPAGSMQGDLKSPVSPFTPNLSSHPESDMEIRPAPLPPQELPAAMRAELDGGQRYHAYRPGRESNGS